MKRRASLVAQLVKNLPAMQGDIPGSGRSPGDGRGYPLQYSWASLGAQPVKNLPAMHEIWVLSLGWEDPWRRAWLLSPVFLLGESPWTEEPGGLESMGLTEWDTTDQQRPAEQW